MTVTCKRCAAGDKLNGKVLSGQGQLHQAGGVVGHHAEAFEGAQGAGGLVGVRGHEAPVGAFRTIWMRSRPRCPAPHPQEQEAHR